jgi:hypothetical protein
MAPLREGDKSPVSRKGRYLRDERQGGWIAPNAQKRLSKLILDSYLSKGRGTASFEWDNNHGPSLEIVARATL